MTEREYYENMLRASRYKTTTDVYPSTRYANHTEADLRDAKILVGAHAYIPHDIRLDSTIDETTISVSAHLSPLNQSSFIFDKNYVKTPLTITNVIFNPPATIVFWSDNTKTVVRCDESLEEYDPEKGIAMAISRKMLADNKRDYYNVFKHWLKKWNKYQEAQEQAERDKNLVEYLEKCFEEEENN